jgi:CheY-like chemotaxis protein
MDGRFLSLNASCVENQEPVIILIFIQATENIRQRQGLNHSTPIIAVTANAMKGDREKVKPGSSFMPTK